MTISFDFLYGAAIGFVLADNLSCQEERIDWGVMVFLGPLVIYFEKPNF